MGGCEGGRWERGRGGGGGGEVRGRVQVSEFGVLCLISSASVSRKFLSGGEVEGGGRGGGGRKGEEAEMRC